jgi:hypothetical protein
MLGMRKHIYRLNFDRIVFFFKHQQIAGLGGSVSAYVNNFWRFNFHEAGNYIGVHPGTWRVGNDHIGFAMLSHKIGYQHILHIACKELGIVNIVDLRVYLSILYSGWHVLHPYHFAHLVGNKISNGARAGL